MTRNALNEKFARIREEESFEDRVEMLLGVICELLQDIDTSLQVIRR